MKTGILMQFFDPQTGKWITRETRRRFNNPGEARELTFTCYSRYKFLDRDRSRTWFIEALNDLRHTYSMDLWAYVLMPEHVHLLVFPRGTENQVGAFQGKLKEVVARKGVRYLRENAPQWLERIRVQEGERVRHRFWQPGGGYDRNVVELPTVYRMIEYIHMNPVRRGLVQRAIDWTWSSALWYGGATDCKLAMDATIPGDLEFPLDSR